MANFPGTAGDDSFIGEDIAETILGLDGNDTLSGAGGYDTISGGNGNDVIAGDNGDDVLSGGQGNDTITGGQGSDWISGDGGDDVIDAGTGNDTVYYVGSTDGTDSIDGGEGFDFVSANGALGLTTFTNVEVLWLNGNVSGNVDQLDSFSEVYGVGSRRTLTVLDAGKLDYSAGTSNLTLVASSFGNDLTTGSGADIITGGIGNDTLNGGLGNDTMTGGNGDDAINGGDGSDELSGGLGNDVIDGGGGADAIYGNAGNDTIFGGSGNDTIYFNFNGLNDGSDTIDGGEGTNDRVIVRGSLRDTTFAGVEILELSRDTFGTVEKLSSFRTVVGTMANSKPLWNLYLTNGGSLSYSTSGDSIALTASNLGNHLTTGSGQDFLRGGNASDILNSGTGNDTVYGGDGDDFITGGDGGDSLYGGRGNDTIQGGQGNDIFYIDGVDEGNDVIDGGDSSADKVVASGSLGGTTFAYVEILELSRDVIGTADQLDTFTTVVMSGGSWHLGVTDAGTLNYTTNTYSLTLFASEFGNALTTGEGADTLWGGEGDDTLSSGNGNDSVYGGNGNDIISSGVGADAVYGDDGDDFINGGTGNDGLNGGEGIDTVSYAGATVGVSVSLLLTAAQNTIGAGTDTLTDFENLIGSDFNDTLTGNNGDNIVVGGLGSDGLNGGNGNDTAAYVGSTSGVIVSLLVSGAQNTVGAGTDTLTSFENLSGSDFSDTLTGNNDGNKIDGGLGDDSLSGAGGDDTLTGGMGVDSVYGEIGHDYLDGGQGSDVLRGGLGNDTYIVESELEDIWESADEGLDTVMASVSVTLATSISGGAPSIENVTLTGTDSHDITGNTLDNQLIGNAGHNQISGANGNDTINGAAGDDTLNGGGGDDVLVGGDDVDTASYAGATASVVVSLQLNDGQNTLGAGTDTLTLIENLTGSDFDDTLTGNDSDNQVDGGLGNDSLSGALGEDTLAGGLGNDTYQVSENDAEDTIIESADEGVDLVVASIIYTLGDNVENLTLIGSADINGTGNSLANGLNGNSGNNAIEGMSGNDTLIGAQGNDTLNGGDGDDVLDGGEGVNAATYAGSTSGVVVSLLLVGGQNTLGAGTDTLTLIENLTGSDFGDTLTGNNASNHIEGGSGEDQIIGAGGDDTLRGGLGGDTYVLNAGDGTDSVIELADEGIDLIVAGFTYLLGDHLENLSLTGSASLNGTGNNLANVLTGNSGNNVIDGNAGDDTLVGGFGDDTFYADSSFDSVVEQSNQGTDTILASVDYTLLATNRFVENLTLTGSANLNATGNDLANRLVGNIGNNTLDGGLANDTMSGGLGNDTYIVQSSSDSVVELNGEGTDLVLSTVTYTLAVGNRFVENLTLTGTAHINATGNGLANALMGNAGNNLIDGGTGNDTMSGGLGNDTFIVQSSADSVIELNGEGTDTIQASVTYTLDASNRFVENLTLTGSAHINATGNNLSNRIVGNVGNNSIDGGLGSDTLSGGLGNDTYYVQDINDDVAELKNEGTDTIFSTVTYSIFSRHVENVILTGTNNIDATGNNLANLLTGNTGNNRLDAGRSQDTYTGGLGADIFVFGLLSGQDVITDFSGAQNDLININAYSAGIVDGGGVTITQSGLHTVINLGSGNTITVLNTTATDPGLLNNIVW